MQISKPKKTKTTYSQILQPYIYRYASLEKNTAVLPCTELVISHIRRKRVFYCINTSLLYKTLLHTLFFKSVLRTLLKHFIYIFFFYKTCKCLLTSLLLLLNQFCQKNYSLISVHVIIFALSALQFSKIYY